MTSCTVTRAPRRRAASACSGNPPRSRNPFRLWVRRGCRPTAPFTTAPGPSRRSRRGAGWEVGSRFRLVSGNLYTPNTGALFYAPSGGYTPVSGAPYSQRLPMFHQLDMRVDKRWKYGSWELGAYLDVQNTYNH